MRDEFFLVFSFLSFKLHLIKYINQKQKTSGKMFAEKYERRGMHFVALVGKRMVSPAREGDKLKFVVLFRKADLLERRGHFFLVFLLLIQIK